MYEKLATCVLPVDDLLKDLYEKESLGREVDSMRKRSGSYPAARLITRELVRNAKIRGAARRYLSKLLQDKEKYGYVYFLSGRKMAVPLDFRFRGIEVFVDLPFRDDIVAELDKLASEFSCRNTLMYEITMMECYYFYVRLLNPHLTWLATESILNNVKSHAHLIMSPERKHSFRVEDPNEELKDEKIMVCNNRR